MEEAKPLTDCGAIIEKYLRWMYRVANQQINARKEDIEEAVANAYLAFLKDCNSGKYQDKGRGTGEYLRNAVNMKYWDLMRQKYRQEPSLDAENPNANQLALADRLPDPDPSHLPDQILLNNALSEKLMDCLAGLSQEQREVMLCVYANERSYQEAADMLVIQVNTVRARLYEARQKLRTCLEQKGYQP